MLYICATDVISIIRLHAIDILWITSIIITSPIINIVSNSVEKKHWYTMYIENYYIHIYIYMYNYYIHWYIICSGWMDTMDVLGC